MSEHTAVPWRTQGWVPTWAYIPVHDARHNLVASLYPDSSHNYTRDEVSANAAFIVTACNSHAELVKALEHVTELLVDSWSEVGDGDPENETAVLNARAALAKATPSRNQVERSA